MGANVSSGGGGDGKHPGLLRNLQSGRCQGVGDVFLQSLERESESRNCSIPRTVTRFLFGHQSLISRGSGAARGEICPEAEQLLSSGEVSGFLGSLVDSLSEAQCAALMAALASCAILVQDWNFHGVFGKDIRLSNHVGQFIRAADKALAASIHSPPTSPTSFSAQKVAFPPDALPVATAANPHRNSTGLTLDFSGCDAFGDVIPVQRSRSTWGSMTSRLSIAHMGRSRTNSEESVDSFANTVKRVRRNSLGQGAAPSFLQGVRSASESTQSSPMPGRVVRANTVASPASGMGNPGDDGYQQEMSLVSPYPPFSPLSSPLPSTSTTGPSSSPDHHQNHPTVGSPILGRHEVVCGEEQGLHMAAAAAAAAAFDRERKERKKSRSISRSGSSEDEEGSSSPKRSFSPPSSSGTSACSLRKHHRSRPRRHHHVHGDGDKSRSRSSSRSSSFSALAQLPLGAQLACDPFHHSSTHPPGQRPLSSNSGLHGMGSLGSLNGKIGGSPFRMSMGAVGRCGGAVPVVPLNPTPMVTAGARYGNSAVTTTALSPRDCIQLDKYHVYLDTMLRPGMLQKTAVVLEAVKHSSVRKLDLRGTFPSHYHFVSAFMLLAAMIKEGCSLTSLYIGFPTEHVALSGIPQPLPHQGISVLLQSVALSNSLQTLRLDRARLGPHALPSLQLLILNNTSITTLGLRHNLLGEAGAVGLSAALKMNSTIKSLDLFGNSCGTAGLSAITAACADHPRIMQLDLGENRGNYEFGKALKHLFLSRNRLSTLKIGYNCIGMGVRSFVGLLNSNTTLKTLDLKGNSLRCQELKQFARVLIVNRTLQSIDLRRNSSSDEVCMAFLGAVCGSHSAGGNRYVQKVCLDTTRISKDLEEKLKQRLDHNQMLRSRVRNSSIASNSLEESLRLANALGSYKQHQNTEDMRKVKTTHMINHKGENRGIGADSSSSLSLMSRGAAVSTPTSSISNIPAKIPADVAATMGSRVADSEVRPKEVVKVVGGTPQPQLESRYRSSPGQGLNLMVMDSPPDFAPSHSSAVSAPPTGVSSREKQRVVGSGFLGDVGNGPGFGKKKAPSSLGIPQTRGRRTSIISSACPSPIPNQQPLQPMDIETIEFMDSSGIPGSSESPVEMEGRMISPVLSPVSASGNMFSGIGDEVRADSPAPRLTSSYHHGSSSASATTNGVVNCTAHLSSSSSGAYNVFSYVEEPRRHRRKHRRHHHSSSSPLQPTSSSPKSSQGFSGSTSSITSALNSPVTMSFPDGENSRIATPSIDSYETLVEKQSRQIVETPELRATPHPLF